MNTNLSVKFILISIITLFGLHASAQNAPLTKQQIGRNHRGFYLSYALGINITNVKMTDSRGSTTIKGLGAGYDFKIGGAIKENLILHATFIVHGVYEPKIYDKNNGLNGSKAENISFEEVMIGAGITYYTEENYLLSASLGFGGFGMTNAEMDEDSYTDKGLGLHLKAGKEWWISPRWGLGLAAYYHNTHVLNQKNSANEERILSHNFGVLLSITLNGKK